MVSTIISAQLPSQLLTTHRQRIDTPGLNEVNYKESGAKAVPFRKDQVPKRHTGQINPNPGVKSETNSAEEFPWESMAQGGSGANLLPATRYQQNRMLHHGLRQ